MRILAIRGENLASLAAPFEIDFAREPLAGAGLFAITGETGAGKSTILDALCLALYGAYPRVVGAAQETAPDPSGAEIGAKDPRALLRRGAGRGFAEADFQGVDGHAYRARWDIARARGRANGNLQNEMRSLIRIADGQAVASGKRPVLEQVEALTDLTFAQFRRTVLLAQGDFDAFLLANENERADLLEKVTGTEIYGEISRRTHAQTDERQKALRRLEERRDDIGLLDDAARRAIEAERARAVETIKATQDGIEALQKRLTSMQQIEVARDRVAEAQSARETAYLAWEAIAPRRAWLAELDLLEPIRFRANALQRARDDASAVERAFAGAQTNLAEMREAAVRAESENVRAREADAEAESIFKALGPVWTRCEQLDAEIKIMADHDAAAAGTLREAESHARQSAQRSAESETLLAETRKAHGDLQDRIAAATGPALVAQRIQTIEDLLKQRGACNADRDAKQEEAAALTERASHIGTEIRDLTEALAAHRMERDRLATEVRSRREALETLNEDALRENDGSLATLLDGLAKAALSLDRFEQARKQEVAADEDQARAQADVATAQTKLAAASDEYALHKAARTEITALVDLADATLTKAAQNLRANLVPGEPCPVCGSIDHPHVESEGAASAFVAHIKMRRADLDAKLDVASKTIEEAKGLLAGASARKSEAGTRIVAARADKAAREQDYAVLHPALEEACEIAGFSFDLPGSAKDATSFACALIEKAQSGRQALAPSLERAKALRTDMERFRHLHDAAAKATEEAAASSTTKQETFRELETQKAESVLALRHIEEKLQATARDLYPYLEAADMGLAAIDTDSATALRKIKALARSSEQMQAGFARLDARLRELAPQCAVAMETAKAAASDVAKAAKVAQDSLDALTHKRDERAMLIDGEPTGAHRTRHNELRRAARARLDVALEDSRAAANRCAGAEAAFVAAGERLEGARLACLRIQEDFEKALCESEIARERIHELLAVSVHDRDELRREIDVLRHALAEADAGLAQRRSDLDSLSAAFLAAYQDDVDADAMRAETEQKRAAVDDLQRRVGAIDSELAQDAAARASAATLSAEIAQARDELAVWQAVDEAIGSASGDKFRRFAQGITLDHLVQLANRQLATLAPRYGLSRTNASELGLSVVDRDMGAEKRGTRSLSGGERFLVSLSLAIALSGLEGRQSFVDTLFIDEGFGSLDAETLDIAVDALECLHGQGRKVGVITHVAAMIERIAVQVRVEKHGYGRSTIAIMGPGISQ